MMEWFKFLRSKGYPFFSSIEYAWHNKSRFTLEGEWPYNMKPKLKDDKSKHRLYTTKYEDLCQ